MLRSPITSVLSGPAADPRWNGAGIPGSAGAAQKGVISSHSLAFLKGIENFYTEEVVARAALEKQPSGSTLGQQQPSGGSATKFFMQFNEAGALITAALQPQQFHRKILKTTKET